MEFGSNSPPGGVSASGAGAAANIISDGSTATFARDVITMSAQVPVIVDFWASWCGPCKQLTPILEKVITGYGGKVLLVKIDADKNQDLAAQLRIQSLPTVYAFKDGRPVDGFTGAQTEAEIRAFIDRVAGDGGADIKAYLEAAEQALEAGDLQSAAEIYATILRDDKDNVDALAGLAQCYLKSGDVERARQTIEMVDPKNKGAPAVARVFAALALSEKAEKSGSAEDLEKRLAASPNDNQCRYDLAVALAGMGRKDDAVAHLLDIVKRERAWNDEAARKQLVELFDAWGPTDAATIHGRRQLSALLFS